MGGGYGMDWFDAMQCCYFQNSYLAEPQTEAELTRSTPTSPSPPAATGPTPGGWEPLTCTTREAGSGCQETHGVMKTGTRGNQTRTVTRTAAPSTPRRTVSSGWTWSATLPTTEFLTTPSVRR